MVIATLLLICSIPQMDDTAKVVNDSPAVASDSATKDSTLVASLPSAPTPVTIGIASADTKPQATALNSTTAPKTSAKSPAKVSDSGKVYVVAKGDNPVTIAKKFKVSYDDLLALNHIDDPRKLKIGQKLLIPEKTARKKQ